MRFGKILIGLIVAFLIIGGTYTLVAGNTKDYNAETKTLTVNDWILGSPTLDAKLDTDLLQYVIYGIKRRVAQVTIFPHSENINDYNLDSVTLINKNNDVEIYRELIYKMREVSYYDVPIYEEVCKEIELGNQSGLIDYYDCYKNQVGTRKQENVTWTEFDKISLDDIAKDNFTFGIFTDVYVNDNVEWIPEWFGVTIDEWASWQNSMNVALMAYHNYDETTGTLLPELRYKLYNGTADGITDPNWITTPLSVLGRSLYVNGADEVVHYGRDRDLNVDSLGNFTMSFWLNTSNDDEGTFFGGRSADTSEYFKINTAAKDMKILGCGIDLAATNTDVITAESWHHVVWILNMSGSYIWVDGANEANAHAAVTSDDCYIQRDIIGFNYSLGALQQSATTWADYWKGSMDETAIYNRSISGTERENLWNGGTGVTYRANVTSMDMLANPMNTTYKGNPANFSMYLNSSDIIEYYTFSTNNSGVWANDSLETTLIVSDLLIQVPKILSSTEQPIGWKVFANDSSSSLFISTEQKLLINSTEMDMLPNPMNTTYRNTPANFSMYLNSSGILSSLSSYVFSTNNTGAWVNDSLNTTPAISELLIEVPKILSIVAKPIGWKVFANDTFSISFLSSEQVFLILSQAPSYTNQERNETLHNHPVNFSILASTTGTLSDYTFSWNGSGAWTNDSLETTAAVTDLLLDTIKLLPNANRTAVGWKYFANITALDRSVSTEEKFTTNDTLMTFTSYASNTTRSGLPINFSVISNDADSLGGFVFSTNNSGVWANDSYLSFGVGTNEMVNVTKLLAEFINYPVGWRVFANDSSGLLYLSAEQKILAAVDLVTAQSDYPDPTVEGITANVNLCVNITNSPRITANLIWNTTNFGEGIKTRPATNWTCFENIFTIPDNTGIPAGMANTYYWMYNVSSSDNSSLIYNATTAGATQTVYSAEIGSCDVDPNYYPILNFSMRNEEDAKFLINASSAANGTMEMDIVLTAWDNSSLTWNYTALIFNQTYHEVCVPINMLNNTWYRLDATVAFEEPLLYTPEFYYIDYYNQTNESNPQDVYLMNLLKTDSTSFKATFEDEDYLPVPNAIFEVWRKYIDEGIFRIVESAKTNIDGETVLHLVTEDVIYKFIVKLRGEILEETEDYLAVCQTTPCLLNLNAVEQLPDLPTDWDQFANGSYDLSQNSTSREVRLYYATTNGISTTMNLSIYKYSNDPAVMSQIVTSGQASGAENIITVSIPITYDNTTYYAVVSEPPYNDYVISAWVEFREDRTAHSGSTGYVICALVVISLFMVSLTKKQASLIFLVVGIIACALLYLINFPIPSVVGIICLAVMLMYKISKREYG